MSKLSSAHLTYHISHPSRSVLILVGPTASGKTAISLLLAKKLDAEIISADSRQMYKYMDIGTAKPTIGERKRIKHHFVDERTPENDFNAGDFGKLGREIIDEILSRNKVPIVVGGSGLYIQSLVEGFYEGPSANKTIRAELSKRMELEGGVSLLSELKKIDPVSASNMLPSNSHRIIRALEVYQLTGVPMSKHQSSKIEIDFVPCFAGLQWERKKLYDRINRRVDWMFEQGLLDEVKLLIQRGYNSSINALKTVGYKEVFEHLEGITTYERMVELIKQNSRRFAKRQLTWFRGNKRILWFDIKDETDFISVSSQIYEYFTKQVGATGFEPATSWSRTKRSSRAEPRPE